MDFTKSLADALNTVPANLQPIVDHVLDRMGALETETITHGMALEAKLAADLTAAESRLLEALGPRLDALNATLAGFLALAQGVVNGRFVPAETALK